MTVDPAIKSCVSCAHCHGHDDMLLECRRYPIERVNYVQGTRWNDYLLCFHQREQGGRCGPEGKGYEPGADPAKTQPGRGVVWLAMSKLLRIPKMAGLFFVSGVVTVTAIVLLGSLLHIIYLKLGAIALAISLLLGICLVAAILIEEVY